jgi:polygalacturonase
MSVSLAALSLLQPARAASVDPFAAVPKILARIRPPVFPKKDFPISKFGAIGDGQTDNTKAFADAIAACHSAGGGRVIVPAGKYVTGPIHLKSNINLHVAKGAVIMFSRDPAAYLPLVYTRWEGVECMNYSAQIYADQVENVAITGAGTLDGQADCAHWWPWKGRVNCGWRDGDVNQAAGRARLFDMGDRDVPVEERLFGEGYYLRPNMVQICRSKNVLIEGLTMINSPMFEINPVLCTNVTVRRIKIKSHGPNNDGCDPDSCKDVLIEKCEFDTGDDCLAIKAGRNHDGRRVGVSSENIVIRDCVMKDGHGGLTIGSEMSGGVRNIFIERCRLSSPNLNQALRFKTNAMRGGIIEHVYIRDIEVGIVGEAILQVDFTYEEGAKGPEKPIVRDIWIDRVHCAHAKFALQLRGFEASPIQDIHLSNCTFDRVDQDSIIEHVADLSMRNVRINGKLAT